MRNKKAQGIGGLLRVIVLGILFLAFFPVFEGLLEAAAGVHTGTIAWAIYSIVFFVLYFFLRFAFNLGADS